MVDENSVLRFYKHTSVRDEIEPNLKQARAILEDAGLDERERVYSKSGGRSGDLYFVDKNLWIYGGEGSFMTASVPNNQRAQIYQLTNGSSQYLSVILKGPFEPGIAKQFEDADFAPKHSYLAKGDDVILEMGNFLWLDDILEFNNPLDTL
jgi:hypothetical protein